jgi:hypothetical protein
MLQKLESEIPPNILVSNEHDTKIMTTPENR